MEYNSEFKELKDFLCLHLFTIYHPTWRYKPQVLNFNLYSVNFQSLLLTFLLKWLTVILSGPLFSLLLVRPVSIFSAVPLYF